MKPGFNHSSQRVPYRYIWTAWPIPSHQKQCKCVKTSWSLLKGRPPYSPSISLVPEFGRNCWDPRSPSHHEELETRLVLRAAELKKREAHPRSSKDTVTQRQHRNKPQASDAKVPTSGEAAKGGRVKYKAKAAKKTSGCREDSEDTGKICRRENQNHKKTAGSWHSWHSTQVEDRKKLVWLEMGADDSWEQWERSEEAG